jgi:hypothetical protein
MRLWAGDWNSFETATLDEIICSLSNRRSIFDRLGAVVTAAPWVSTATFIPMPQPSPNACHNELGKSRLPTMLSHYETAQVQMLASLLHGTVMS